MLLEYNSMTSQEMLRMVQEISSFRKIGLEAHVLQTSLNCFGMTLRNTVFRLHHPERRLVELVRFP